MASKKKGLTIREKKLVKGRARGLSQRAAALKAGYSPSVARSKAYEILERPLVRSALTEAFERVGGSMEDLMRPIAEGVKATTPHLVGEVRTGGGRGAKQEIRKWHRFLPDYPTRLKAAELGMAVFGGLPKQLESPAAPTQGLTVIFEDEKPNGAKRRLAAKLEQSGEPVSVVFEEESAGQERALQEKRCSAGGG